ncbi:unnamed protein product [Gongylonema pulchrum]|uniref:Ovule protein n=1 Tax=Gongylonema pulchrum TaxID=637853 RepID=A0A183EEU5_9BILA|nr:unnamed protein product [Gongylonema pulchrum]
MRQKGEVVMSSLGRKYEQKEEKVVKNYQSLPKMNVLLHISHNRFPSADQHRKRTVHEHDVFDRHNPIDQIYPFENREPFPNE